MKIETRIAALEKQQPTDGKPVLALATWRAERESPDFEKRWPIVAARRAAAREAEQLAGGHDETEA